MLSTLLAVVAPPLTAQAVGTVLFENTFHNRTVDGTGTVTKPNPATGTNTACLTASGNSANLPLLSCTGTTDAQGAGKLRLTANVGNEIGAVFGASSFPTSNGLDVTFKSYQWNGTDRGADGMTFVLAAVNPASPVPPAAIGPSGGSLGYSAYGSVNGLTNAYLGVGLDVYGNFSSPTYQGSGCTNLPNINTQAAGAVVIRGPGTARVGYCGLNTTNDGTTGSKVALRALGRQASVVPVQVLVNPTSSSFTSGSTESVAAGTYKVIFTPVGQTKKILSGPLPAAPSTLYPSTTWTNANGVPKQLAFGFVGSNGSVTDAHEIDEVKVLTFDPVPQLDVTTTSYVAANPALGAPVNYAVTPSVAVGSSETQPISVTQTTPAGVVPVGAYGSGWTCAAPIGRAITCTTTGSSFASGTTLPIINVVGIVTGSGMTAGTVQNSSVTTVSSADGNPGTDTVTTAGTVPTGPSGLSVTPAIGTVAGGGAVTVTGSNITSATAIEIGTTTEQEAGTPVVLLPCQGGATTGCFTVSGSSLVIASMPARATSAAVSVTVVTRGIANAAAYTYADKPATIATPTATAGLASATLAWVVPAENGSAITGYVVTPYLGGVAQTVRNFDAGATTRVISGLTAGGNYTFRVTAVNAYGTSTTSAVSNSVTPYSVATAPTITSVRAGTSSVVLNWNAAASNGGSAVTGYVVTPYIGSAAQTPQSFTGTALTQTITGLTPGTAYTFTVAASLTTGTSTLYRINAGGPLVNATDGGPNWAADSASDSTLRTSGSLTSSDAGTVTFDSTVPADTPTALFVTQRYDPGSKGNSDEMKWALPVTSGANVKVRLYFANRYTGTGTVGDRVFDVAIDGTPALTNFDIVAAAGADQKATMREFPITSDGTINIDFGHEVENPLISAIEIIQVGLPALGPPSARSTAATPNQPPTLTFNAPPAGEVGAVYSTQLTVINGTSPFVWSISVGSLPTGLTLSAGGLLSGTPTASGSFPVTVRVVDASGETATKLVTLVIAAAPVVTFTPVAGEVTVPYSEQPTVAGGTGPFAWAIASGTLPAGLTINPTTGLISGTPTASGSFSVTVSVTDGFSQVASRTASIVIAALPTITSSAPPAGQVGLAYSTTFTVSGGSTPLVWSITAGNVPSGLSLNTGTGVLSGTPTTIGSSPFTVLVTDSFGKTTTKAVTLVVNPGPIVITKSANVSSAAPGGTVAYTIAITNSSSTTFTGVNLSDPLDGVLDDATYAGGASATTGTLTYTSSTLGWTGDVAAGATVTITYSVLVNNPDVGNKVLANTVTSSTVGTNCPSGGSSPLCTTTVTVAGLSIVHTANGATTTPGSAVTFTIAVTNTGQTPYSGATLTESLSGILDDATYTGATATSGTVSYANPTLSWTGNLAVGATATITYTVTVANPDPGNKSLSGTVVSSTSGSTCPSGNPAASCTATITVLVPALSITNTAGVGTTTPGSTVPYTVILSNTGQTAYPSTSVSVAFAGALDDATYNGNAAASAGTVILDQGSSSLIWTGALAVGATVTITGSLTVLSPDPGNKVLTTVASSSAPGSTCPPGSSNPACTSTVQVLIPALTITKSSSVTSTTPGSVVGYTVLVTNTGQTPYTGASLTDALAGVLDDATFGNNAAANSGTASFTGGNVGWTGDLAVGASATITYSVTVNNPDLGNRSLVGSVTSTTVGNNCLSGGSDSRCTSTVAVLIPSLTIDSSANVATTTPGSVVRYTTTVTNTGQTTYSGVEIRLFAADVIDDADPNADQVVTTGSLGSGDDPTVLIWTLSLAPGQTATMTGSMTAISPPPAGGNRLMVVRILTDAVGSNCPTSAPAAACSTAVPVLIPGLTITKTADRATVVTGGTVVYTILVHNTGQTTYTNASFTDSLATVLTDSTYPGTAVATSGTVSYAAPTLSWSGSLAPTDTATITYSVVVRDPDPGDKLMTNTVVSTSAGSNCAASSTDSRCRAAVFVLVPGLTVVKTATVATTVPGGQVGFSVKVTNSGTTTQTGATFSDSLAGVLDDATYAGVATTTVGTLSYVGSTLTWTGDLVAGASATIFYTTTVNQTPGNNRLTNTVVSTTRGSNCAAGSTDPRCSIDVPVARLILERVPVPPATTTPGSVLDLPVYFRNTGQVPYVGITVEIPRADAADDLFATDPDTASSGSLVRTASATQWTGDIPVGGTVKLTIIRTVRDPATGNLEIKAPLQSDAPGSNCPTVGATDSRCTYLTRVLIPGLTISKSANATSVDPGGAVGYTVTVTNSGQTPYAAASVTDSLTGVLDDAVYNGNAVASGGTVSYAGSTLSWTGSLAVGATVTITYSVTANDLGAGDKNLSNRATSSDVGSTCPPAGSSPACVSNVSVLTPALTIVKSADLTEATLGSTVTYTVVVTNSGQTSYPSASFADPLVAVLDDATYLAGSTSASVGAVGYTGGVLSWSGTLAPGATATVTYAVRVNTPDAGNGSLANTVTSTSAASNCAAGSVDGRCSVVVAVINAVALTFTKTSDVATSVPGGVVTYTVRVANASNAAISTVFTDPLTGVLDDAAYNGNAVASSGTASYSAPNLSWAGSVPAQSSVTVTYSVTVAAVGTGDELLVNTVSSTTLPSSNNCAPASVDPRCADTVPIARLDLVQTAAQTTATPGSVVSLTTVFTNTGQVPYTGISVISPRADTSDDTILDSDQVASSGTLVRTPDAITWTGDIPVGGIVTTTRTLTVKNPNPGNQIIRATLSSTAVGSNCPVGTADPRCSFRIDVLTPQLTITKTANATAVPYGGTVGYTITVNNNGQTPYTGASFSDSLAGILDDATYNANAVANIGSLSYTNSTLTWSGDLAVGQVATITYSATVTSAGTGDKVMANAVSSSDVGSTCPPASGTLACRSTVAVLTPGLTILKTADVTNATLNTPVVYTILVRNTGQTSYAAATFNDPLADVTDDAIYNTGATTATSGTVSYAGGVLRWTGALAPGASATITYTVTIKVLMLNNYALVNTVSSTTTGSNCAASSIDSRCTARVAVTNATTLTFTKTADAVSTVAAGKVDYTVTVTNAGIMTVSGATFTDPLAGILDDASYDGNAAVTGGTGNSVVFTSPNLVWTGDVAAGATVTVKYSVTVRTTTTGDEILSGQVASPSYALISNNCLSGSTDVRCANRVTVSSLLIQQAYAAPTTTPGSVIRLTATFTNTGQTPYEGITILSPSAGTVDDAYVVGDQTATSGSLVLTATAITWTGNIPVGGVITVTGTLVVQNPDPGDKIITGTLVTTAPGSNCAASSIDVRCTAITTVLVPGLSVVKSANKSSVDPGGSVGYTVTVHNTGQTPYGGAVVSDSLVGVLDDAVYNGNALASAGAIAYAGSTLSWTGDLGVGAVVTITYSVTVNNASTGDKTLVNPVSSNVAGSSCLPASGNAACLSTVSVLTPALTIVKSADLTAATLGSTVTYTMLILNSGQTTYQAATFADSLAGVLDDATYDPAATTATTGTASYASGVLTWTGALAPGASATVTYAVRVNTPAVGDGNLANTVTSTSVGSNCAAGSNDGRCSVSVAVINAQALTFTKTANVATTIPGGVVSYTVRVANATGAAITNVDFTDSLTGVLDDATYNADAMVSDGTVSYSTPSLNWSGTVPPQGSVTLTYSVTVAAQGTGNELLLNTVTSASVPASNNCLVGGTDPRCASQVAVARLDIAQTPDRATATPGDLFTVTGTFTNTGQVPYTGISVSLDTTDVTDDATPEGETASSGSFVRTASGLTWTGDIGVGDTITTIRPSRVKNPDPGSQLVTATYRSVAPGNNCAAGSTDPRCTYAVAILTPGLTITTTANTTSVVPAGVVGYTMTVRNSGQTTYAAATVTDTLTGVLDDATYNGDATTTAGSLAFSSPTLTWTGELAAGATATVSFTVTAHRPADGDKVMFNRVSSTDPGSTCLPGSSSASCTITVAVLTPSLTTVVTASKTTAVPGDVVSYTVTATNNGQTDYPVATFNAPLAGLLDDAVYGGNASATTGTVVRTGDSLVWTGALLQGAQATITYSVTIKNPVPVSAVPGNHRLEQQISSIENDSNCPLVGAADPRCATSVPIASLQFLNSVVGGVTTAKPTDVIRYIGTFTNTGQVPYVGITLYDSFGPGALDDADYNGDATTTSGSVVVVVGSGQLVWTGDVAVGQTVTLTGSITIKNPNPGDGIIATRIATATPGSNCPIGNTVPACGTRVDVLTPKLTVSKAANTTTTTPGGIVTYTITATNNGQTPYTAAKISDDLAGVLDESALSGNATSTTGSVALVDQRLTWTGDLGLLQSVVITYSVVVDNPDLGDKLIVNRVTSDELGSTCPTGGSASACTTAVTVLVPALTIGLAANQTTTTPGATVNYTLSVTNAGQTTYTGAQVATTLAGVTDDAAYAGVAVSSTGSTVYSEGVLTWTGSLAPGATATITYSVTVYNPDAGDRQLTTSVASAVPGSTCSPASPCVNTVTVLIPGLAISTSAVPSATPGDPVTFTITVNNTGQTAYVGTTVSTNLSNVLDDASFDGSISASSGTAGYTAPNLTWTGSLAPRAVAVITYQVRINNPDLGNRVLTTTVVNADAGSTCSVGSGNAACTATVNVLVPALSITKTANSATTTPGSNLRYTIVLKNTGQTNYTAATISDSLAEVLTHSSYNGDAAVTGGGVLTYQDSTIGWTGDLLIGAIATITYSVRVDQIPSGDRLLINQVVSTTPGSTCPPDSTAPACLVTVRVLTPALLVTKTADTSTVVAGSAVAYTITVKNTGETDYAPATFTDSLTDVLDDATYADGSAVATIGTVAYTNDTLSWSGPLAIGQTATITYVVTSKFPALGNRSLNNRVVSDSAGATCPAGSTDPVCRTQVTVLEPALTITKSADLTRVVSGGRVNYTIQAINTGEAPYPAAVLTDSLAGVLDDATYNGNATASSGVVVVNAGVLTWTGSLGTGQSVLITYSVTTTLASDVGDSLVNAVSSTSVGSTCPAAGGGPSCVSTVPIDTQVLMLSNLTPSFTLTGLPGSTVTDDDAVGMTVTTNSGGGYVVSVQAAAAALQGRSSANTDTIPVGNLKVRDSSQPRFTALSTSPFVVHTKNGPSGPAGDAVSNDYQVDIPFVASDTYSTTLEYIVATQ